MSLQNYNVEYIYESEKARKSQNPKSQQFKADQGGRISEILRYLPQRFANFRSNRRTKRDK